eukprot:m.1340616 g.1340616  ORF g.1340616 m.1340616 type:complete len:529 (-) comp24890_c1_seq27:3938-5524(-)
MASGAQADISTLLSSEIGDKSAFEQSNAQTAAETQDKTPMADTEGDVEPTSSGVLHDVARTKECSKESDESASKKRKATDCSENNDGGGQESTNDSAAVAQLELVHRHMLNVVGQPISDIPPKRGRQGGKGYAPTDSAEDREKLAAARADWCTLASATRVVSIRALSTGVWHPDASGAPGVGVVELTVMRGSHFKSLGHHCKQRRATVLKPEEALFLLDRGALEVWCGGVPLTLSEAYAVLLPHDMPLIEFTVYLHLRRLGYVVNRSTASNAKTTDPSRSEKPDASAAVSAASAQDPQGDISMGNADTGVSKTPNSSSTTVGMLSAFWGGVSTFLSRLTAPFVGGHRIKSPDVSAAEQDVAPILRPHDCITFDNVYERLRQVSMKPVALHDYAADTHCRLKIALDVYKMRPTFKKTDPGFPDFRVCVCDFTDEAPTLPELRRLTADADPALLKFAVVHGGTVSWYGMLDLELPVYADHRMMGFQSTKARKSKQGGANQSRHKKRRVDGENADAPPNAATAVQANSGLL